MIILIVILIGLRTRSIHLRGRLTIQLPINMRNKGLVILCCFRTKFVENCVKTRFYCGFIILFWLFLINIRNQDLTKEFISNTNHSNSLQMQ